MTGTKPGPAEIRQYKIDNPEKRERDIAAFFGISEAEYVAAWLGHGATRITTDFAKIFPSSRLWGLSWHSPATKMLFTKRSAAMTVC